jgi:NAD-specific glutamate dehydrogenase
MRADEGRERSPEALLEDLAEELRRRFGDAEAMVLFGRLLFARAGTAYAEELGEEERVALVASAFRFFEHRTAPVRCRVWTPTFGADGWDSAYTIVETHLTDRPFIVDTIRCSRPSGTARDASSVWARPPRRRDGNRSFTARSSGFPRRIRPGWPASSRNGFTTSAW